MNNQDQLIKNNEPNNFIDMDALLLNLKNEDSRQNQIDEELQVDVHYNDHCIFPFNDCKSRS
ncbi:MAG: hypothetical protein MZV64_70395 [Ignavibacteriales bacterium]|nr:hypothetical protein [Ignavibacteriales bacterium]